MITLFGENYYINLENVDKYVNIQTPPISASTEPEQHISIVKYEMVKTLIDVILSENEDIDEKLANKVSSQLTIPFKLAWNTMLMNKLIEKF
jgi:hypothetical protein